MAVGLYTSTVRVTGGELGRRRLRAPAGHATRPSSDRLRQALFNILGDSLAGLPFLDGFAGSGAVGIEAFSRGARPVVWIESDRAAARTLRRNLAALALPREEAAVIEQSFASGLRRAAARAAANAGGGFGVIFLDPPYAAWARYPALLAAAAQPGLLQPGGQVILEARRNAPFPEHGPLTLARRHEVGDSVLAFYQAKRQPPEAS